LIKKEEEKEYEMNYDPQQLNNVFDQGIDFNLRRFKSKK